ncbi:aluminium induced protein with YGL and LRDR motifs [Striga asiatica]|uniref:Aluminium induced protein with YGL and LRDR motifs n=1 Tax=Striga asiatica TaxID=4170 RepID=A0A5A7PGM7_STRAF|nr:aluminium induced protein with YGL and LRDR motifs [Striga asiatica]
MTPYKLLKRTDGNLFPVAIGELSWRIPRRVELVPSLNPRHHGLRQLCEVRINGRKFVLDLLGQLNVAVLDCCAFFRKSSQTGCWLCCAICRANLSSLPVYLGAPASPHVVISPDWLTIAHEPEVHSGPNQIPIEAQIHTTHREDSSLGNRQNCIHIS